MTLVLARTSERYVLMVSDRRVVSGHDVFDANANKEIVFGDRNAVVVMGYTGMAHIGAIPTDQWLVQALTGITLIAGRRGPTSVPHLTMASYEEQYWGVRVRKLRDQLSQVRPLIVEPYRDQWVRDSFDLLMTGFEWNHGKARPYSAVLSKPANAEGFDLDQDSVTFRPRGGRFPVLTNAIPSSNIDIRDLRDIDAALDLSSAIGTSRGEVGDQAEALLVQAIRRVSARLDVVGPDCMSVLMSPPWDTEPTIRVRYSPAAATHATLGSGESSVSVPLGFTPWIVRSGCITAPSILGNMVATSSCGPYQVVFDVPVVAVGKGFISGQDRKTLHSLL